MKDKKAIALVAAILIAWFLPDARGASHTSIFTMIDLSLKKPLDERSKTRLVSIGTNGLVTIRLGSGSTFTARGGESFRNVDGLTPGTDYKLVSVDPTRNAVVIRYETRYYLSPAPPKPNEPK